MNKKLNILKIPYKIFLIAILISLLLPSYINAKLSDKFKFEDQISVTSARVKAMGGAFTAIADGIDLIFYNPAGLAEYSTKRWDKLEMLNDLVKWKWRQGIFGEYTPLSLGIQLNKELYDKGKEVVELFSTMSSLSDSISSNPMNILSDIEALPIEEQQKIQNALYSVLNTTVDIKMNYALNQFINPLLNIAFGSYINSGFFYSGQMGLFPDMHFKIKTQLDYVNAFSFGMHIPPRTKKWAFGITYKQIVRTYFEATSDSLNSLVNDSAGIIASFINGMTDPISLFLNSDVVSISNFSAAAIPSIIKAALNGGLFNSLGPIYVGIGYSFDLGFMYYMGQGFTLGLNLTDIVSRITWIDQQASGKKPGWIRPTMRVGLSYKLPWRMKNIIENIVIGVDMEDLFFQYKPSPFNWSELKSKFIHALILRFHTGVEANFFFNFLTIRLGINQGYPTAGIKLDFNYRFLENLPIIKAFRPSSWRDWKAKKSVIVPIITFILAPILYSHLQIEAAFYGEELGTYPSQIPHYNGYIKFSLSYGY